MNKFGGDTEVSDSIGTVAIPEESKQSYDETC